MRVVANRYLLEEELGRGGVATVYRGRDRALDVVRAIKLVSLDEGEEQRSRLRDEARAMATLDHPNICQVYDVGADGEHDFIVMEYVEKGNLAQQVDAHGPLDVPDAIAIILQVLAALEHAHGADIVHRDVKPENILLGDDGRVRLCDFGIALVHGSFDRMTKTGSAMGSLPYMPPEQRQDPRYVSAAADQYATGATLFYLITGRNPVDLYLAPKLSSRWSGIPESIRTVLQIATAARASDRYADVGTLSRKLCAALEHRPRSRPVPAEVPVALRMGRPRGHALLVGFTAVILAISLSAVIVFDLQRQHAASFEPPTPAVAPAPIDLTGSWLGSWNKHTGARLQLSGPPNQLQGKMWIPLGEDQLLTRVSGRYDPVRQELVLVDVGDTTTPGVYTASVLDEMFLRGSFENEVGAQATFSLVRVDD